MIDGTSGWSRIGMLSLCLLATVVACAQGVSDSKNSSDDDDGAGGNVSSSSSSSSDSSGSGGSPASGGGSASSSSAAGVGGGGTARAPQGGELVISEMMPNPLTASDDGGEWIELVNVAAVPLLLDGCLLTDLNVPPDDEVMFPSGLVVMPGQYLVVAKSASTAENGGINGVVLAFGTSFTLANGGDEAVLVCNGLSIDSVAYDSVGSWPFSSGVAMQLPPTMLSASANDLASNWCAATTSYGAGDSGTPGTANASCP